LAAQAWPQRTVRFIVPLGAGSGADIGGRLLADRLSKKWGQPVVVENRPGGDGIVAIGGFVNARDDHILLFAPSSTFTAHPYLHDNLPYKPADLAPIARVSNTIIAISVPSTMQVKSLDELIKLIRSQPGKLNWAGVTGALDFLFEAFLKTSNLQMSKVPYRNTVDAANDLAEGRIQVYRSAYAIIRPRLLAGKARMLAVSNSARAPASPDTPTVAEAGYPALTIDGLVGLFGPPSMPMALRERIAGDIKAVIDADPAVGERLTLTGQFVNPGGPAEFGKSIDEQRETIAAAAKVLGVKAKQ
jgi:tripartite-type tricarboxylate transporter receptor subunit TctC